MKTIDSFDNEIVANANDILIASAAAGDVCINSYSSCENCNKVECSIFAIREKLASAYNDNSWNDASIIPSNGQTCLLMVDDMQRQIIGYYSQDLITCDDFTVVSQPVSSNWLELNGCPISSRIIKWKNLQLN